VSLDFEAIRRRLTVSVRRVCPAWLADRAEDIVQNAMIRVLESSKKNEHGRQPPASFLWKVAYSTTIDEIRRVRRRRESGAEMAELERHGPVDTEGPLRSSVSRELAAALDACLRRIRENRRLIVGFYLLGHSLAESEELSGWSPKRVRNLLYRGLADLRGCLTAKGF
jgi:RNA polymerase sigma-70 factor (ECF subfamily)